MKGMASNFFIYTITSSNKQHFSINKFPRSRSCDVIELLSAVLSVWINQ